MTTPSTIVKAKLGRSEEEANIVLITPKPTRLIEQIGLVRIIEKILGVTITMSRDPVPSPANVSNANMSTEMTTAGASTTEPNHQSTPSVNVPFTAHPETHTIPAGCRSFFIGNEIKGSKFGGIGIAETSGYFENNITRENDVAFTGGGGDGTGLYGYRDNKSLDDGQGFIGRCYDDPRYKELVASSIRP
ncbi:hypothetical protein EJ04DRAFT_513286 [Polyplosphaeria fusca]|uniref:Uncharacterized protein n=1 Tax=Polyplosphaeria fusca TaxID=682080 RepID=A0A9P4QY87_9PLEO|nr:hypothetical protein EJ04DRAFT_513286 [Polyplosphaeria fusca]